MDKITQIWVHWWVESPTRLAVAVGLATHADSPQSLLVAVAEAFDGFLDVTGVELGRGAPEASFLAVRRAGRRWEVTRGSRVVDAATLDALERGEPSIERRTREGPRPHLILPIESLEPSEPSKPSKPSKPKKGSRGMYLAIWSRTKRLPADLANPELLRMVCDLVARGLSKPSGHRAPALPRGDRVPTFAQASRQVIEQALTACAGKIYGADGAAALLDLKPATLQGKMRKLGIERKQFVRSK